jgi:hypothetical protein
MKYILHNSVLHSGYQQYTNFLISYYIYILIYFMQQIVFTSDRNFINRNKNGNTFSKTALT